MISGNMIRPTASVPKNTSAIGRPDARLFFEPQNSTTVASARFNRASPDMPTVTPSMIDQQDHAHSRDRDHPPRAHRAPDVLGDAHRERRVDDEQDRAAV